jgi:hypothetical protein
MRFLLRLVLLLVITSYLLRHYGSFLGENLWHAASTCSLFLTRRPLSKSKFVLVYVSLPAQPLNVPAAF